MRKLFVLISLFLFVGAALVVADESIQVEDGVQVEALLDEAEVDQLGKRQEGEELSIAGVCVRSFEVPLRIPFCPSEVGTARFEILANGRLRVTIRLVSGLRIQRAFLFIDNDRPDDDFEHYDFRFDGDSFTTSRDVCRNNRRVRVRIALAVIIIRTGGDSRDSVVAWAVAGERSLPAGVDFTAFNRRFGGFFTVIFCPCNPPPPPPCCPRADNFEFVCGDFRRCGGVTHPNPNRFCFCGFTPDARGNRETTCLASRDDCPHPSHSCTKNSDCPRGQACQLSSCCRDARGNRRNICNDLCKTQFPDANC